MADVVGEDTLLGAEFLGPHVNRTHATYSPTNNYIVGGHGKQLVIVNSKPVSAGHQYFILDFDTVQTILLHTRQLLSNILTAFLSRRSPINRLSSIHTNRFNHRSPKSPSQSPTSPECRRSIIVTAFLDSCEKFIRSFVVNVDICACKSSDVKDLQRGQQDRISFLINYLCRDQRARDEPDDQIPIDAVLKDILQYLWQYHVAVVSVMHETERIGRDNKIKCLNCGCISEAVEGKRIDQLPVESTEVTTESPSWEDADGFSKTEFLRVRYFHDNAIPFIQSERQRLSERLGLSALKPIRRSIPREKSPRISNLAKHFELLSREFEKERQRERRQRNINRSRAFPPVSSKPVGEVYSDLTIVIKKNVKTVRSKRLSTAVEPGANTRYINI
ncbi:uncharacterized protein TRUGW13939_06987 [Talaromyces rugulosus]|uniref:Uncharacterized protein n=1 Tax=Talaromyces rugulosus TaxID=121627 RepID=A0A7H8R2A0_TALRU|nr:uncharacterized protein TRUGW13939_06987 [Talaromyces rugulosus]QKX59845.1 hypothetical protein TRUGW13939_06987 [Talaromyces rugulosus]